MFILAFAPEQTDATATHEGPVVLSGVRFEHGRLYCDSEPVSRGQLAAFFERICISDNSQPRYNQTTISEIGTKDRTCIRLVSTKSMHFIPNRNTGKPIEAMPVVASVGTKRR